MGLWEVCMWYCVYIVCIDGHIPCTRGILTFWIDSRFRCFDTTFPRGSLVYHHPLFQRDRPELMSKMSAGMNKYSRHHSYNNTNNTKRDDLTLATLTSGRPLGIVAAHPVSNHSITAVASSPGERLGRMQQQQQQQQMQTLATAERLCAATTMNATVSQAALRGLCLQTLRDAGGSHHHPPASVMPPPPSSYLQQYLLGTNHPPGGSSSSSFLHQNHHHPSPLSFMASRRPPPPPTLPPPPTATTTDLDLSSLSILRLLQLRDMLSRARGSS